MRRPMIGLVPLTDRERDSYWMLPGYMQGIEGAGGLPVMLPLTNDPVLISQITEEVDGFLFTGGQDVSPSLYGQARSDCCGECSVRRDEMERELFNQIYEKDKPVLGICRGIQLINVLMGGTLYQDLPTEYSSDIEHHQKPPYDVPCHTVRILDGSPLHKLLGKDMLKVNSYHHQAVRDLAEGLEQMAVSEDGLTEAVRARGKQFIWAVQWHPEFSFRKDEDSRKIFREFVRASINYLLYDIYAIR